MEAYFKKMDELISAKNEELRAATTSGEFVSPWTYHHDTDKFFITTHIQVDDGYRGVVIDFDQDAIVNMSAKDQAAAAVADFATALAL